MSTPPRILKVHHVQLTVPTGAEADAHSFYCEFLGLREVPKPDVLVAGGGFWLQAGEFQVHVGTEESDAREHTKAHVAYEVEGLDGWRERLRENGIEATDGLQIPNYRRFEFRDPFGNRVEFLEKAR